VQEASEHTTQVLLHRIRAGDEGARAALVRRVEPLLRRFAKGRVPRLLRHEHDTADLLQTTWVSVLDKLDRIAPQAPGDFFAYLRSVLLNALRDSLRRHGRTPIDRERSGDERALELPAENVAPEDWIAYEQALAALEPPLRLALVMRFEFGMSFGEIGSELGESADAVRMRVSRGLARVAGAAQ
jgi:RNA polymerase sigma factor (sigma-70 family)